MSRATQLVLVDDHRLVRTGFRALVSRLDGIEIVGEAANGLEGLSLIREKRPDVALVDNFMPLLNGIELAAQVSEEKLATRVVILSMYSHHKDLDRAIRAGVVGFIRKDSSLEELAMAIRAAASGEGYFCPAAARLVLENIRQGMPPSDPLDGLTTRHRQLIQLIAEGKPTSEIATILGITPRTTERLRCALMNRLDLHEIAGIVRFAVQERLIATD